MSPASWALLALALGPLAGFLVARASLQMAAQGDPAPTPTLRRYGLAAGGATLAAVWAAILAPGLLGLVGAVLGWQLLLIAMLDAEHFWLPHRLTVPLGLLGLAQAAAFEPDQILHRLIGVAIGFGALALIAWLYRRLRGREGMGGGDFRLLGAAGAWVGWEGLPSVLVLASITGLTVVGIRALRGRRPVGSVEVPFGVYLALGLWFTWLYGPLGLGG
jgi:leader peptidase (prepilin peptidase)/N-methyltransferase